MCTWTPDAYAHTSTVNLCIMDSLGPTKTACPHYQGGLKVILHGKVPFGTTNKCLVPLFSSVHINRFHVVT